jgi:topA_arch: DNA topoisomerase I
MSMTYPEVKSRWNDYGSVLWKIPQSLMECSIWDPRRNTDIWPKLLYAVLRLTGW